MTQGHLPESLMYVGNEQHLANDLNGRGGGYDRWMSRTLNKCVLPHPLPIPTKL